MASKKKVARKTRTASETSKPLSKQDRKRMLDDRTAEILTIVGGCIVYGTSARNIYKEVRAELEAFYNADKGLA